jgi:hypothetical protein
MLFSELSIEEKHDYKVITYSKLIQKTSEASIFEKMNNPDASIMLT